MIEKIESLGDMMNVKQLDFLEGVACIHLCINVASTGNADLINLLENGRG